MFYYKTWTDDDVEALKRLWGAGLSASKIAAALDGKFSRNAIIGKAHRMGLPRREAKRAYPKPKPKPKKPRPTRRKIYTAPPSDEPVPLGPVREIVGDRQCHWIHGEPSGDFRYCGHPVGETAYCPYHQRKMHPYQKEAA